MRKYGRIRFNDPKDLRDWSRGLLLIILQSEYLDNARRYYKRQKDKASKRKSEEIKKLLNKVSEMQADAIRELIPIDHLNIFYKNSDTKNRKKL